MGKRSKADASLDGIENIVDEPVQEFPTFKYAVQQDGTIIDGNHYNAGDVIELTPEYAGVLKFADVRLTEILDVDFKPAA